MLTQPNKSWEFMRLLIEGGRGEVKYPSRGPLMQFFPDRKAHYYEEAVSMLRQGKV